MYIDWDFGYRSRWCGIDPWKVSLTLKKNLYGECYDGHSIQIACEELVRKGKMFKKDDFVFKDGSKFNIMIDTETGEAVLVSIRDSSIQVHTRLFRY